jgi:pilus assembly protein CpaE
MNPMTLRDIGQNSGGDFSLHGPVSLVGIGLDHETGELLRRFTEAIPMIRCRALQHDYRNENHDSIVGWLGAPSPDVCLIDFDKDRHAAAQLAEIIRAALPSTAIFAVSSQAQPDSIIDAMRNGCSEYLVKPVGRDELLNAVARVGGRKRETKQQHNAQIMTFIGAKGGCGVSTLVTQLGALLASSHTRKTLLVDLHPDFGDDALYLGLTKHRYHSFELVENNDRLDSEFLQSFLVHHSSGLDLIPAPEGEDFTRFILPGALAKTFDFLRRSYEFILIDSPPGLNDQNLELMRYADHVFLVTVAEVSALRNVVRHADYLVQKQLSQEKVHILLNRHQKRSLISDGEIEKVIRKKIFWKIPNQYAHVVKTINGGNPVAQLPSSEVMRNLNDLAGILGRKSGSDDKRKDAFGILKFLNR